MTKKDDDLYLLYTKKVLPRISRDKNVFVNFMSYMNSKYAFLHILDSNLSGIWIYYIYFKDILFP